MILARPQRLQRVEELLRVHPVVAILGARQVGKTTLAREFARGFAAPVTRFDLEDPDDLARLTEPKPAGAARGAGHPGRGAAAAGAVSRAAERDPNSEVALPGIVLVERELGRPAAALPYARRYVDIAPTLRDAHDKMAAVLATLPGDPRGPPRPPGRRTRTRRQNPGRLAPGPLPAPCRRGQGRSRRGRSLAPLLTAFGMRSLQEGGERVRRCGQMTGCGLKTRM